MSAEERGWWNALKGDEILHNTAGLPPYDVESVARFLEMVLNLSRDPHLDRVLDLGCGTGRLTRVMAERNPRNFFYGIDIAPSLVAIANSDKPDNMHCDVGDGRKLFRPGGFCGAYSVTVFQHLPHDAVANYIGQVGQILPVGCRFAFTYVVGTEDTFLSHQTSVENVARWCAAAGFDHVTHLTCPDHPLGWRWAVATKGSTP